MSKTEKIKSRYEAYLVIWEDSRCPSGGWVWVSSSTDMKHVICQSLGFLVEEDDKCVKLAANVGDEGDEEPQANAIIVIPKSCITEMRLLCLFKPLP